MQTNTTLPLGMQDTESAQQTSPHIMEHWTPTTQHAVSQGQSQTHVQAEAPTATTKDCAMFRTSHVHTYAHACAHERLSLIHI
eukprot:15449177-Alexandrium_andersonii.AAC.1